MILYKYNSKQQIIEINLKRGSYLFELWGAQGGQGCSNSQFLTEYYGGRGAFVSGKVHFFQNQKLFLFIGEKGHAPEMCNSKYNGKGGFNGVVIQDMTQEMMIQLVEEVVQQISD